MRVPMLVALALAAFACTSAPSDDDADWHVDLTKKYVPKLGAARFVVPSSGLPTDLAIGASNNNVDVFFFEDRLFLAWRTSQTHFASADTLLHVVSSTDGGHAWSDETTVDLSSDLREPRFYAWNNELWLLFFQAGTDPAAFEPKAQWRIRREGLGKWTAPEHFGVDGEVPWELKERDGRLWLESYRGAHYSGSDATLEVLFRESTDGRTWTPVEGDGVVYRGGVSEVGFEFDRSGDLWAVMRNEDGDASGFGSLVCHAAKAHLGKWDCPEKSDPNIYESPKMFRHGDDLYLLARKDLGGTFDEGEISPDLTADQRKDKYLLDYWNRAHTTALYEVDTKARAVVWLADLPGDGDTAYPSIRRTGTDSFLVANYTSPLDEPDLSWNDGQVSPRGTQIYLLNLDFVGLGR